MRLDDLQIHTAALRSSAWPEVPDPPDDHDHIMHLLSQANRAVARAEHLISESWAAPEDQLQNVGFRKGVGMELAAAALYAFMLADHLKLNMDEMIQCRLNHEWTRLTGSSKKSCDFYSRRGSRGERP